MPVPIGRQLIGRSLVTTPVELGVVKQRIEARTNPEIAKARAETAKALQETEAGRRAAIRQISDRVGLGHTMEWCEPPQRPMWLRRARPLP